MKEYTGYMIYNTIVSVFFGVLAGLILFFNCNPLGILPSGATHAEDIIFGLVLAAWAEVIGVRSLLYNLHSQ